MAKRNIYDILRGTFLISDDSFKNWRMILFLSFLAFIMISSSHSADWKVHQMALLNEEVKQLRSIFIDKRAELMQLKMQSSIVKKLEREDIKPSTLPPKKIRVIAATKNQGKNNVKN